MSNSCLLSIAYYINTIPLKKIGRTCCSVLNMHDCMETYYNSDHYTFNKVHYFIVLVLPFAESHLQYW